MVRNYVGEFRMDVKQLSNEWKVIFKKETDNGRKDSNVKEIYSNWISWLLWVSRMC